MKPDYARKLIEEALVDLENARSHLNYSFQQVAGFPASLDQPSEQQLESADAFTGRFARTVDLLVNKVLRGLDRLEMLAEGTLLDVVNRAEKRGFVRGAQELREMKDVRNIIAHDYAGAKAAEIFTYCREQKPVLDSICDAAAAYAAKVLKG